MSRITKFETWVARNPLALKIGTRGAVNEDPRAAAPLGSFVVVVQLTDDDGFSGIGSALATYGPDAPLAYLHNVIKPIVLGRQVHEREAIWADLVRVNRGLAFFPISLPGPVDVALWDLAARRVDLPLYQYLGSARTSLPVYASSGFLPTAADHVAAAESTIERGLSAYKIHPRGGWREQIETAEAVRDAFPALTLMLDSAGSNFAVQDAMRVGRELERLRFHWFEEPFHDVALSKYVELSRNLDIAVAGTEAVAGGPAGVAEFVRAQAVDIVRADVSWTWGVTGLRKVLGVAEAFGINCEIHTTTMGIMDAANLHVACSTHSSEFYELLEPAPLWQFPLARPLEVDSGGYIHVPEGPGLGVEIDWSHLDDHTLDFAE